MLIWINEIESAKRFWEEQKTHHGFSAMDLEDFLFNLIICEREIGWGYRHPEFRHLVRYYILTEECAFKLSTIPLSELLRMDKPSFSSLDGLINVSFDKHELERVAEMVPEKHHGELQLPLILLRPVMDRYPAYEYKQAHKVVGSKMENFLLQKLLKFTSAPFKKYTEAKSIKIINKISTLKRRKFNTIYKALPGHSSLWLSVTYKHPYFPEL